MQNTPWTGQLVSTRKYAMGTLVAAALGLAAGIWLTSNGVWTPWQFLWRWAGGGTLLGVSVAMFRWMRPRVERAGPDHVALWHAAALAVPFGLALTAAALFMYGTAFGRGIAGVWWQVAWLFGFALAGFGWTRRVGDSQHCPKCEYECGIPDIAQVPIYCPECGTMWLGVMKRGRRVRSRRYVVAGVVIVVGGFVLGNPVFYMGRLAPHLPTPVLLGALYLGADGLDSAWDELSTRTLGEQATRAMGEHVLSVREIARYQRGPSKWFEGVMATGGMPPELVERFYGEGFGAGVLVPARVKAGEPFAASLRVTHAAWGASTQMAVLFAGYRIGDGGEPRGRERKAMWAHQFRLDRWTGRDDALQQTLSVDQRGPVEVVATYWVVYAPSFQDELVWLPDGSPAPWKRALWMRRFESRQTITVE